MIIDFEGRYATTGATETEALGERLGAYLEGGAVLALEGDLGTGKTTLVRGIARGLQVLEPGSVKSPSYTLVLRYDGPIPLLHLDAYFMHSQEDIDLCGLEEALARKEVVAIEWGTKVLARLPDDTVWIRLEHQSPEVRRIEIKVGTR